METGKELKWRVRFWAFWQEAIFMKHVLKVVGGIGILLLIFYISKPKYLQASVPTFSDSLAAQSGLPLSGGAQRQARIKRGDTLVLEQQQLAGLLPVILADYQSQGMPSSSVINLMGNRYTIAEQTYRKGEDQIKISIADYNAAYTLYNVATAIVAAGVTMDTEEQKVQEIDLGMKEIKGWEMYDKREQKAVVTLGIADRFLITIEAARQQNADDITQIVENLELNAWE